MSDIVVIGSLNMDLVVNTPRLPALGETILGSGFMTGPGGKGANQAVAAARLGGRVGMIGCVGDDLFGRDLVKNLQVNGVETSHVKALDSCPTGTAVIVVKDGDNFIIVDPGANYKLTPEMMEASEAMIGESRLVVLQLEIPIDTVAKAVEIAARHNVPILLNPSPARELPAGLLQLVDYIILNESECELITGIPVKTPEDAGKGAEALSGMGIKYPLITMGSRGALYMENGSFIHKSGHRVKAVDTTAAGDTFAGAVATVLAAGGTIGEAVDFANAAAALAVMKKGAQASIPALADVSDFILKTLFK